MDMLKVFRRSPLLLPLAGLAAVAMLFVSEGSYRRSVGTLDTIGAVQSTRTRILGLQQDVLDAEAAQRGYLLTGNAVQLQPYDAALRAIDSAFVDLRLEYGNREDLRGAQTLTLLQAQTDRKLSDLSGVIRQREAGRVGVTVPVALPDIDRQQINNIRALGADLLAIESRRMEQHRDALYDTLLLGRIGIATLIAVSLLGLYVALRQAVALRRQQREQQYLVQTEHDRLEVEVRERTAQLTQLTQHLQTAREDERARLARNLHDELGGLLTSAKLDAARIKSRLGDSAPEAQERLVHLVGTLNSSIALGRRIIEDLRPSTLDNLGLAPTLEILAREFSASSGIGVSCDLKPAALGPKAELAVYRLVQESITNITKYAKANRVWLTVGEQGGRAVVSVRDDGIGFDPTAKPRSAYGLVGMRYRIEAEGGTLQVNSAPGQGTSIQVSLPLIVPAST